MDTEPRREPLRIREIEVEGLFNLYDHHIPLNMEDRVTILHGVNGVGKTRILQMLHGLCSGGFKAFEGVPFREFRVTLSNGDWIAVVPRVARKSRGKPSGASAGLHLSGVLGGQSTEAIYPGEDSTAALRERLGTHLEQPRLLVQFARLRGDGEIQHDVLDDVLTRDDLRLPVRLAAEVNRHRELRALVSRLGVASHLIATQRLMLPGDRWGSDFELAVEKLAERFARRNQEVQSEYARVSQSLERTFPERLMRLATSHTSQERVASRLSQVEQRRQRLIHLGLLREQVEESADSRLAVQLRAGRLDVLDLYLDDTEKKLDVLDDMAARTELLVNGINEKVNHKRLVADGERGLFFVDADEQPLPLSALSSGEQQELVLLYDLLFNIQANTLVLIDEPELSLHLLWQKRFMNDLLKIAKVVRLDALVATHSPYIVGSREDLMVELKAERAPARAAG